MKFKLDGMEWNGISRSKLEMGKDRSMCPVHISQDGNFIALERLWVSKGEIAILNRFSFQPWALDKAYFTYASESHLSHGRFVSLLHSPLPENGLFYGKQKMICTALCLPFCFFICVN